MIRFFPRVVPPSLSDRTFDLAIVLGSGLGGLTEVLEDSLCFSYGDIPGLPTTRVEGHQGRLVAGAIGDKQVLCFQGRYHLYEGYSAQEVCSLVQMAFDLHIPNLLLTNAAGGIRLDLQPGDFMWITDHLNLSGANPLQGMIPPRFPDLSTLYNQDPLPALKMACDQASIPLKQGVLCGLVGPTYETPAEVRMLAGLGADAVSMSTVNEAIAGHVLGMRVMAMSLISNAAAGLHEGPLDHQDVLATGKQAASRGEAVIRFLLDLL